ncbi:MAG: hypothetical protein R3Y08_05060 [Rikenellaceae bacterium]
MKKIDTTKVLPIALGASILLFGALLALKAIKITSADSISLADIVSVVALLSYTLATLGAFIKKSFVKQLLLFTPLLSLVLCATAGGAFISSLMWMSISSLGLAALYQVKVGNIPYWNIIMGEPNSTTTLIENIAQFFNKSANQSSDEIIAKSIKSGNIIVAAAIAAIVALLIYAWGRVDFNIQWNLFESWMTPILYVVGLCITIFNPVPKYTSWLVYKDRDGKETHREKDNDIIEFMFNSFFLPMLIRFFVYPMVAAAIIYYPIMCILALVEAIIPILFLAIIAAIIPLYIIFSKGISSLNNRGVISKFAPIFTIALVALIALIWLQNTDNRFTPYFQSGEDTQSTKIETVVDEVEDSTATIDSLKVE